MLGDTRTKLSFYFSVQESSHKTLYEYINGIILEKHKTIKTKKYKKFEYHFKYVNQVPIRVVRMRYW